MRKLYILIILIFSLSHSLLAIDYYVSNTGSDLALGTSEGEAWQTIAKLNSVTFNAGDNIYFEKGGVWREMFTIPSNGTAGNHINISNYGTGDNPIIYGSDQQSTWENLSGNIWYSITTLDDPYLSTGFFFGVGYKENNFNANGDMLGYPINFADNTDTGCPINVVMSGRSAASQTATFTVRWRIIKPLDPLYTSEPTASGTSGSYVITQDLTIGLNELMFAPIDVSDAIPTRNNGFGDQLWITVERTSGTADFALTNIGAEYWTWSTGGHY